MSWRNFILNRFWLKLFSLTLATLLWFAIQSNLVLEIRPSQYSPRPSETRDFRRPIIVASTSAKRRVFKLEPREVDVRLGGNPEHLRNLKVSDIQVYVNLAEEPNPIGTFPIEVSVPPEVTLRWVWPSHVHVEPISQD